jgi:thymidylate synthase ThyX
MTEAKIILDSINETGHRLTTFELTLHRYELASFNTHRLFSRNSASSRAIPIAKQMEKIEKDLAYPIEFGTNQPGMQAGPPLEGEALEQARAEWVCASQDAMVHVEALSNLNVHKEVANRLLEPFMWHKIICTSVDYGNFFKLRAHKDAQKEIRELAYKMFDIYEDSQPQLLTDGQWHMPYITDEDQDTDYDLRKVSAARNARVSYLNHDGKRDLDKDIDLFEKLTDREPKHDSPLEHVAVPCKDNLFYLYSADYETSIVGNFPGWLQLRHENLKDALAGGGEQGRPYVSKN